jgi:glycosyltransferase involved in cell wall biosynthesis
MTAGAALSARHRFIVPGAAAGISGGNLYNRALLAACCEARASVAAVAIERAGEQLRTADAGFFWLDTLYLEDFRALDTLTRRSSFGLLIHYLPSLVDRGDSMGREGLTEDERHALDRADAFIVTSAWMRDAVRRLSDPHRPCLLVEPGRPEAPAETPPQPATGGVRAVLVANLVPGKGILPFLRALGAELTATDRLELAIVGGSPDEAYAERCHAAVASDPQLSARVSFTGELAPGAVCSRVARGNLFVSSSLFEAYGMALCEARVAGVPIVARAGGNAAAWTLPESGGELCAGDRELARSVVRLCRDSASHASRLELAQSARLPPRPWSHAAFEFIAQARRLEGPPRRILDRAARDTTSEKPARTTR